MSEKPTDLSSLLAALHEASLREEQATQEVAFLISCVGEVLPPHLKELPPDERKAVLAQVYWTDKRLAGAVRDLVDKRQTDPFGFRTKPLECYDCEGIFMEKVFSWNAFLTGPKTGVCPECQVIRDRPRLPCPFRCSAPTRLKPEVPKEKKEVSIHALRSMSYKDYLETEHWKATRLDAMKRARFRCQLCNSSGTLNTHHRTYQNRGCEKPEDLTVLCKPCHEKFHDILPKE